MMMSKSTAFVAFLMLGHAAAVSVTPTQKVIQLLEGMVEKGTKEKQDEEIQFTKFKGFCESTVKSKRNQIKEANERIESLNADIAKYEADAEALGEQIAKHDEDISTWTGDQKASNKVRAIEKSDYDKTRAEFTDAITALNDAVDTLMKQAQDVAQGPAADGAEAAPEALMQVSANSLIPAEAKRAIAAFLQVQVQDEPVMNPEAERKGRQALGEIMHQRKLPEAAKEAIGSYLQIGASESDAMAESAPEANAYEFQAQGVVDMMTKLSERFEKERDELDAKENGAIQAFQMIQGDLKNQRDGAIKFRDEKKTAKAKSLQDGANAQGDLVDTTGTRDEDTKYTADLVATCEQKASAYEQRQKLRAEELEAINKAIEILSSGAVAGAAKKHLPSLMQTGASLAQLRSITMSPGQLKVVAYLKKQASRINSRMLSALAVRVAADPFKKVKKMIKDLIVKLMEEANDEAEHKGWCDMEMGTNAKTRKEKSDTVLELTAEIDELEASVAKLAQDITEIGANIADIDASVAKATAERDEEKAKNTVTIKDAKGAQAAVSTALGVLNDFYEKAAEATALVQQNGASFLQLHQEPPATFDEPYTGMGGESGGVVGMLEVIQSDFARLESETSSAEAEAAKEYNEFMTDSRVDKASKQSDFDHKSGSKQDQEQALQQAKAGLAGTQKELDSANAYYDKLKPDCLAPEESFEDRQARRKEEIESLQTALQILQGEDVV